MMTGIDPLSDALRRMDRYAEDIEWWANRVAAWADGRPPHATGGWTLTDDLFGLQSRIRDFAEEREKAAELLPVWL
jgi:hypothetical protein